MIYALIAVKPILKMLDLYLKECIDHYWKRNFQLNQNKIPNNNDIKIPDNFVTKRLKYLLEKKQTNLTASLDVTTQTEFFNISRVS